MLERKLSVPHSSLPAQAGERLAERRRTRRRRSLIAFFILLLLLLVATVYGLWQSAVRISHVQILGADQSLAQYTQNAMQGSYFGIIPRDSIFFFPASAIRANIIIAHPDIAAVSIFRNGLTGISIKVDNRVPIARWCGDATRLNLVASCYVFDASGVLYATTSVAQPLNSFVLYEAVASSSTFIGLTLPSAKDIPSAFDFARQLATLGPPVVSVTIHDGEVDDILMGGTRITYVLGHEQNAFTALVSARDNFNLADGSIDYVDLRFDGKVYLKKK